MSHSLDYNIREQLAAYLASEMSLREFENWFFSETWDVDKLDNQALTNLVYGIKLRLAEFSHGDWTEKELHDRLRPFIEKYDLGASPVQIQFGTSNMNILVPTSVTYSGRSVGIQSLTVYG